MEKGRLRTPSSTVESRKFKSPEETQPERLRWVYCTLSPYYNKGRLPCNTSRRGLTRVAYPGQGNARARQWDKRKVVTPTSLILT